MPRPDPKRPREGQEALFEAEAVKQPDCVAGIPWPWTPPLTPPARIK